MRLLPLSSLFGDAVFLGGSVILWAQHQQYTQVHRERHVRTCTARAACHHTTPPPPPPPPPQRPMPVLQPKHRPRNALAATNLLWTRQHLSHARVEVCLKPMLDENVHEHLPSQHNSQPTTTNQNNTLTRVFPRLSSHVDGNPRTSPATPISRFFFTQSIHSGGSARVPSRDPIWATAPATALRGLLQTWTQNCMNNTWKWKAMLTSSCQAQHWRTGTPQVSMYLPARAATSCLCLAVTADTRLMVVWATNICMQTMFLWGWNPFFDRMSSNTLESTPRSRFCSSQAIQASGISPSAYLQHRHQYANHAAAPSHHTRRSSCHHYHKGKKNTPT